ncbi:hypothetical protein, partial [Timonella senegalensis]
SSSRVSGSVYNTIDEIARFRESLKGVRAFFSVD